jgi:NADPH-dependent curcumin reductase CurA
VIAMPINRQYILRSRPVDELADSDLELREVQLPELSEGEVRARTTWISIDPTIRIWMSDVPQYLPPIVLGDVVRALGTGVIEESKHPGFAVGDAVSMYSGWQTYVQGPPEQANIAKLPPGVEPTASLALFGATGGFTAYFGLYDVVDPKPGETVVVDAASGSVGSLVGQLAKLRGCRVIGITGGAHKCAYVKELGFDACIDYKSEDVGEALGRLCPDGIDVCFENVGGPIFDAILLHMKLHGRISLCGLIAGYDKLHDPIPGPYQFGQILMKRLRVQGFIILDYIPRFGEALPQLAKWAAEGKLVSRIYEVDGFERLPDALRELVGGHSKKIGKMVVKL